MSLDVRWLTNGEKTLYCVIDSWCDPPRKSTYETLEEVPKAIKHYAEKIKESKYVGPDTARILGFVDIFYPEWKDHCCLHPEELAAGRYDQKCIAEGCGLYDYHTCPFNVKAFAK